MDELIAATADGPGCRRVGRVGIVSVRFLAGDTAANAARVALHTLELPWVPRPGGLAGDDPLVAWRSPTERIVLGTQVAALQRLVDALQAGQHPLAMAVDLSEALEVCELHGPHIERWLAGLIDPCALPAHAGSSSCTGLHEVPVLLLRVAPHRLWLCVERPLMQHVLRWLQQAHHNAGFGAATGRSGRLDRDAD